MSNPLVLEPPRAAPAARAARRAGRGSPLYLLPAVVFFLAFIVFPVGWIVWNSLFETTQDASRYTGLGNYLALFQDPVFWAAAKNMTLWLVTTVPVQMLIGGSLAYLIETRTRRSTTFFRTIFFIPVVTSVSVIGIVWSQMYAPYYGLIQGMAKTFGLHLNVALLSNADTTIFALIIVNIWEWTGFSMLMYIAGLHAIPNDLFDSAKIDGATGWMFATRILVPLLAPATKALLLLGVIGTLQTFPLVYLMTGGGPNHASEVFGTFVFREAFILNHSGYAAALSTVVLLIAFLLTVAQIRFLGSQFGTPQARPAPGAKGGPA